MIDVIYSVSSILSITVTQNILLLQKLPNKDFLFQSDFVANTLCKPMNNVKAKSLHILFK